MAKTTAKTTAPVPAKTKAGALVTGDQAANIAALRARLMAPTGV